MVLFSCLNFKNAPLAINGLVLGRLSFLWEEDPFVNVPLSEHVIFRIWRKIKDAVNGTAYSSREFRSIRTTQKDILCNPLQYAEYTDSAYPKKFDLIRYLQFTFITVIISIFLI